MIRRTAALLASLTLIFAGFLIAAPLVAGGDPCFRGLDRPARSDEGSTTVKLDTCTFHPTIARVPVGSTVRFVNGSDMPHLITGANLEWGSWEAQIERGAEISQTFPAAGIYPFSCMLHPGMTGAVIVGDATPAAAGAAGLVSETSDSTETAASGSSEPVPLALVGFAGLAAALGAMIAWLVIRRRWTATA